MALINTVEDEKKVMSLIKEEYGGVIPKYTLEGILLYEFNVSNIRMYHTLLNLINNDSIELITLSDGEYYKII